MEQWVACTVRCMHSARARSNLSHCGGTGRNLEGKAAHVVGLVLAAAVVGRADKATVAFRTAQARAHWNKTFALCEPGTAAAWHHSPHRVGTARAGGGSRPVASQVSLRRGDPARTGQS